ncbi:hypothetical protein DL768_011364 [Monosporascus sp. mg162]|nr:hypothetical protein DL768_011364 [Monosporascus sp. mg162]
MATPAVAAARGSGSVWVSPESVCRTLSRITTSRRHRSPRLPTSLSPNRILELRLRSKKEDQRRRYAPLFKIAAQQKHERLPLITLQAFLRKHSFPDEKYLPETTDASDSVEWRDRLRSLASRGWSEQDIDRWVWILSAEDGDARVQRLVSTKLPIPPFLLLLLLRSDEKFRRAESLICLINFVGNVYRKPQSEASPAQNGVNGFRPKKTLSVDEYLVFLRRIVYHVQRLWPQSIVTVARLTADYIRNIPLEPKARGVRRDGYTNRCLVFNTALLLFKRPANFEPVANMEFNWRAQKVLLSLSENLDRRLVINKLSFRAIRQVMIGLKRSAKERWVAMRYAKTWPPYRQDFDGLDAKRAPEDDYSRSVKAGILMKQEGYIEDDYDRALDILGGSSTESPTIQTRSLPPKEWKDDKEQWNFFNRWGMKIRATRNANEAWSVFTTFSDITPNVQVYGEMFLKLQARELHEVGDLLPGDSRETFPVHHNNLSEYELARQSPPTVAELYDQMISRGIKPEGHCLYALVRNARTIQDGLRYLRDSPLDPVSVNSIALFKLPSYQALRRIPLLAFNSYIQLLCRLQPDRRGRQKFHTEEIYRIRHAITLIKERLQPHTTEGANFRPPWHAVFRALARPYICLTNGGQAEDDDAEALRTSTDLLSSVVTTVGMDPEIFMYYCRIIQKVAVSRLASLQSSTENPYSQGFAATAAGEHVPLVTGRQDILRELKAFFNKLVASVEQAGGLEAPTFLHNIGPVHLHTYMRTLAFLEDTDGMVDVMRWMLRNRSYLDEEAERKSSRGPALIAKALCAFQAFAGPQLSSEQADEMARHMDAVAEAGGNWRWPTPEEVDRYVQSDLRGGSPRLRQRYLARWWQNAFENNEFDDGRVGRVAME